MVHPVFRIRIRMFLGLPDPHLLTYIQICQARSPFLTDGIEILTLRSKAQGSKRLPGVRSLTGQVYKHSINQGGA